jgi:hypothetical protein
LAFISILDHFNKVRVDYLFHSTSIIIIIDQGRVYTGTGNFDQS